VGGSVGVDPGSKGPLKSFGGFDVSPNVNGGTIFELVRPHYVAWGKHYDLYE
jgi:hypothetical protein